MNEQTSNQNEVPDEKEAKEQKKREYIDLAIKLEGKTFPFPGINPSAYATLKAEEMPEYSTPIDDILARMKTEGIKITRGAHPESGNIYVLPAESSNIEMDSLFPKHLMVSESMPDELILLITANKK